MTIRSLQNWIELLRASGTPWAPTEDRLQALATQAAQGSTDQAPFLHWRARRCGLAHPVFPGPVPEQTGANHDALLWRACGESDESAAVILDELARRSAARSASDAGALLPQGLHRAIEVWTETELASLHALWWLGRLREVEAWRERALDAARWHVIHLQPDNATNRPWAIHLFVTLATRENNADAEVYAQTLLHNCHVQQGRPDEISSLILIDAAESLSS